MHFLTTGGTGAGKTLFTLKWVREIQLKSDRPVCYTKSLQLKDEGLSFGWKCIDIKEWEKEPDGTIFVVDECHKDFPIRGGAGAPPPHVQNLAEARHRGFDFFFITQHPKNLDVFIRRLIAAPGWHRHIKRRSGAPLAAVLQWDSVYERVERNDAGEAGGAEVSNHTYPKDVYNWYHSTTIDTAKFRLPKAAIWVGIGAVVAPALLYVAFTSMSENPLAKEGQQAVEKPVQDQSLAAMLGVSGANGGRPANEKQPVMTTAEYIESLKARLRDFPQTAPRYDAITQPVVAPYPAACILMKDRCACFTQQATLLPGTSNEVCLQIVERGYFVDWQLPASGFQAHQSPVQQSELRPQTEAGAVRKVRSVPVPGAAAVKTEEQEFQEFKERHQVNELMKNLAIRNAGPRMQTQANWVR